MGLEVLAKALPQSAKAMRPPCIVPRCKNCARRRQERAQKKAGAPPAGLQAPADIAAAGELRHLGGPGLRTGLQVQMRGGAFKLKA